MKTSAKMEHLDVLRVELGTMKREHRDLDDAIGALDLEGRADPLTLRRLKKRKLALKDQIARIEDQLTPGESGEGLCFDEVCEIVIVPCGGFQAQSD